MMKKSHVLIGTAAGVLALQGAPLELVIPGAALGSVLPDFDMQLGIPHRTITHWLVWPLVVLILPLGALFDALAIGWIMHILADCLTVGGLAPFWPLRFRLNGFLRTGGAGEYLLMGALMLLLGSRLML